MPLPGLEWTGNEQLTEIRLMDVFVVCQSLGQSLDFKQVCFSSSITDNYLALWKDCFRLLASILSAQICFSRFDLSNFMFFSSERERSFETASYDLSCWLRSALGSIYSTVCPLRIFPIVMSIVGCYSSLIISTPRPTWSAWSAASLTGKMFCYHARPKIALLIWAGANLLQRTAESWTTVNLVEAVDFSHGCLGFCEWGRRESIWWNQIDPPFVVY